MTAWLDENCGADGWAMRPSGMRGCLTTPSRSISSMRCSRALSSPGGAPVTESRLRAVCSGCGMMIRGRERTGRREQSRQRRLRRMSCRSLAAAIDAPKSITGSASVPLSARLALLIGGCQWLGGSGLCISSSSHSRARSTCKPRDARRLRCDQRSARLHYGPARAPPQPKGVSPNRARDRLWYGRSRDRLV
jgi:hypothetical protein